MGRKNDRQDLDLLAEHVLIGEIARPHGIMGEVKIYPYSEQPENFKEYKVIVLQQAETGRTDTYNVVKCRGQGKFVLLQLEGVTSREAALSLQGSRVWLKKKDLPVLSGDEYYWHQLKGLLVFTESGEELGRASKIFHTMAHDIMVVTGSGHEYMIPVKRTIIKKVDPQSDRIIISPPPGLLEINK
jgi:16S rRNA processing protein RimM